MYPEQRKVTNLPSRVAIGALVFVVILLAGISAARAAEIVPSIGISRAADGGDTKSFLGVAVRGSMAPMVKNEIAIGYRSEKYFNGDLKLNIVPMTASLWLAPAPMVYAGGGVGIYHTSLQYREALLIPNTSEQTFGFHLGGGMNFPVAPMVSIDLQGRYVFMEEQSSGLSQTNFDPDFWTTAAGVAIKF